MTVIRSVGAYDKKPDIDIKSHISVEAILVYYLMTTGVRDSKPEFIPNFVPITSMLYFTMM